MSVWCAQIILPRSSLRHFTTRRPDQSTESPHSHGQKLEQYNDDVDGRCGERGIWLCKGPRRRCCCWLNAERWTHLPYQPRLLLWWQRMACFGHRLIIYQLYWSSPTDHANHPSARFQSFSLLLHFYTFSYNVYFSHLPNCFRLSTIGELHLINNIKAVGSFYSFVGGCTSASLCMRDFRRKSDYITFAVSCVSLQIPNMLM